MFQAVRRPASLFLPFISFSLCSENEFRQSLSKDANLQVCHNLSNDQEQNENSTCLITEHHPIMCTITTYSDILSFPRKRQFS